MDGEASSKIHSDSEMEGFGSWSNNKPEGDLDEVVTVIYSPDRQLTDLEADALMCNYPDRDCGT